MGKSELLIAMACVCVFGVLGVVAYQNLFSPEARERDRAAEERRQQRLSAPLAPLPVARSIEDGVTVIEVEGQRFVVVSGYRGLAIAPLQPLPAEKGKE